VGQNDSPTRAVGEKSFPPKFRPIMVIEAPDEVGALNVPSLFHLPRWVITGES
jgi:hypothetical protein